MALDPPPPRGASTAYDNQAAHARATAEAVYRAESRRVFATLIRLLGDFDLAEEALADAFRAALEQWPREGVPANPRAWLVSAGRFKAIDGIRRRARFRRARRRGAEQVEAIPTTPRNWTARTSRTIGCASLTCCHPALSPDAGRAHAPRGLRPHDRGDRARVPEHAAPTLAQRIVRAKAKIRDARIPYQVPTPAELPERLDSVLRVVYLVFNEGYSASSGDSLTRVDLSSEAIRLGRLLVELLPEPEAIGLLALMLLQESRRTARASSTGELVLLADQDRSLWNLAQIAEGSALVERALASRRFGPYTLQAAIAAVHAAAATADATDWSEIVGLYDILLQAEPSPVVELNRAVAVAMRDGPAAGLELVDAILARGDLQDYRLAHAARADLCRRLGDAAQARGGLRSGPRPHPAGAGAAVPRARLAELRGLKRSRCRFRRPRSTIGTERRLSEEHAMKFLCLIRAEKVMEQMPETAAAKHFEAYREFTAAIRGADTSSGATASCPQGRDDGAGRDGKGLDHRRPLRGDEGAARRLLCHRGAGPGRGDPGGGEDPRGVDRIGRGAADRGGRADAPRARLPTRLKRAT